jgi:type IV pilus assembly protein PilC
MLMNFAELSQFYQNLASLDQAGINYLKAFESLKRGERNIERQTQFQFMINHLTRNRPLSEGFRHLKLTPVFDIPLIKAAEDSGRLVETFKTLSKKYADAHASEKEIRGKLLQPFFTLVVALFAPKFPDLFSEKITLGRYLRISLWPLAVLLFGIYYLYRMWMRSFYDLTVATSWHKMMSFIPFLKGLSEKIALQRFSSALAMMLESGLDVFESLKQAANSSADPKIKRGTEKMTGMIRQGKDIGYVFQTVPAFPSDLVNAVSLGAESGKLPEFLNRYSDGLKEEIHRRIQVLTKIIPAVLFGLVTIYVLITIVAFYKGHLDEAMKVLDNV